MNRKKINYDIYIDSKNAIGSPNNIELPINNPPNATISFISLKYFNMNNTIYNVRNNRNFFTILTSTGIETINIPNNNYNLESLISELTTQLNATDDTFTITEENGYLTINSSFINFAINPNENNEYFLEIIGFNYNQEYIGQSITSIKAVDLIAEKNIFVNIDQFDKRILNTTGQKYNFIVPVNCQYGNQILYEKKEFYFLNDPIVPDKLNIRLLDSNGELLQSTADYIMILDINTQQLYNG